MKSDRFKSRRQIASVRMDPLDAEVTGERGWCSSEEMQRVVKLAATIGQPCFGIILTLPSGLTTPPMIAYGGCVPRVGDVFEQGGREWVVEKVRHDVGEDGEALQFFPFVFAGPSYSE